MGSSFSLSAVALTVFEILNEIFIAVGSGASGIIVLVNHGLKTNEILRTLMVTTITAGCLIITFQTTEMMKASPKKVIFITGCDSGLGFSFAQHACEMGFTVLAGCLNLESKGAQSLRALFGEKITHVELDITRSTSVQVALDFVNEILISNPDYQFWALVNNAGVMVFGEFEWLTDKLIQKQLDVNLYGTFQLTKAFCPLLRVHRARIINVSSHCALASLPGLSVYGATKAALKGWNDALRVELRKYGVSVVLFIPGSFITQSNIMGTQVENCFEMYNSFSKEQLEFYGDYFNRYNNYLNAIGGSRNIEKINDSALYDKFEKALLELPPSSVYINESFYYSIYHTLFKCTPVSVRDFLITRFMQMPSYTVI
ncbi:hypothetical protein RI129_003375 [Pyrocoelia pectoralis]|uniref:Uncharacterized protein n=1 Tax=Pyrocoelia pectoralis TaxID=417401 RepID=A0AAN7VQA4_9COLE